MCQQLKTIYILKGVLNSEMQYEINTLKKENNEIQNKINELNNISCILELNYEQ